MNRIFPTFDQPDMKATLEVSIVAPKGWVILSNELKLVESEFSLEAYKKANPSLSFIDDLYGHVENPEANHFAVFKRTQLYPTYLYGFISGEYSEIKCENIYNVIFHLRNAH